jgi:DNA-binding CsgD family transcriptional regulator
MGGTLRSPLLERGSAVAAARAAMEHAAGGVSVLVVCGEHGLGRTRLLDVVADEAATRGITVRSARADAADRETPFALLHALLGDLAPGLAEADADPVAVRRHLVARCIADARSAPVTWLVDDVDHADAASLAFLADAAAAEASGLRLAVVVSALEPPAALTGEVVRLEPLSAQAVARLLGGDPAASHEALAVTGGNPLLLSELADLVALTGVSTAELTPAEVARAAIVRLVALPVPAQMLARAVALFDGAVEPAHAAAVAGLEVADAVVAASDLRAAGLFADGARLAFAHELDRAAIADDAPADARAAGHAAAATVLTAARAPAARIAWHLRDVPPHGNPAAVAVLHEAGRQRAAAGDDAEAAALFARALAEPPADGEAARLLLDLGEIQVRLGSPAAERHLHAAIAALDDPQLLARAVSSIALQSVMQGPLPDAPAVAESVLADLVLRIDPALSDRLVAKLLLTLGPGTLAHAERLRRVASEGVRALGPLTLVAWISVTLRNGERPAAELAGWAREAAQGVGAFWPQDAWELGTIAGALSLTDRADEAMAFIDRGLASARANADRLHEAGALALRAREHLLRGRLAAAEADARGALAVEAVRHERSPSAYMAEAVLVRTLIWRGAVEEAATIVAPMPPAPPAVAGVGFPAVMVRLATGDDTGAVKLLLAEGERLEAAGVVNPTMARWRSTAVRPLLRLGEHARASTLAAEELVRARRFGSPLAIGWALSASGLAGGGPAGIEQLEAAEVAMREAGSHVYRAQVLLDLGAALRRANRRTDAREALSMAADLAQTHGAEPLVAASLEELRACGARPRRVMRSGVDALTPRERRVAELAADGLTNRAIAAQLFVTLHTVEMHLSNAYRKLEVTGRAELPRALGLG